MSTDTRLWTVGAAIVFAAFACGPTSGQEPLTATELHLKGRYHEAAERFAAEADRDAAAAVGLARCQVATGKREEAHKTLVAAAARFDNSAEVRGELALLEFHRGNHQAAQKHADAAIALDKDCVPARWVAAELLRTAGKLDEAEKAYAWFIGYHNRAPQIDEPWDLIHIGRAVAQHARWTRNSNQFRRLVSDFYPAVLQRDPGFWPARLEAAQLYAEKFNEPDAADELAAALAINPQAAELHAAKAALAVSRFDLAAATSSIDRALEINSQLVWAHQLRADVLLADLRLDDALQALEKARQLNPRDEQTLGRMLTLYLAQDGRTARTISPTTGLPTQPEVGRDAPASPSEDGSKAPPYTPRAQQLVDQVAQHNPHCGELFLAAADAADRMRRFPLAAELYREAGRRMPELISVRGQLGLVLMRLGEETEAAQLLEESFAIDPFNVRVKNMLEVLDVLKTYAVIETEHFVIKFDRGQDELLARFAARHLEEKVHYGLTSNLGYKPKGKTLIEIFSRHGNTSGHGWFSARMVGLPFVGTVGACAGKVIAITSPNELPQKFNWAQVLEHEFVHVLNLQRTDFAVPHWLTEGLAVHLENRPRPAKWTLLLAGRAQEDRLYNLDTLTLGFIRPASSDDWTLAYCQAELYVEYLLHKYGDDAVRRLLSAYARRLSTPAALQDCFAVDLADFEAGYKEFVSEQIAAAGKLVPPAQPSLAELVRAAEANPGDADAAAALALGWLASDDKPAARRYALAAREVQPKHQTAAYVLARLQLSIGDTEAATRLLAESLDEKAPHADALALLAALRLKAGESEAAEKLYALGDKHFPHEDRWLKGLARIALQSGDRKKILPLLLRWSVLEPDNTAIHKRLAQIYMDQAHVDGIKHLTTCLHIDVQDAETHALLADARVAAVCRSDYSPAIEHLEIAIRLDGTKPDWYVHLAGLLILSSRPDDARLVIGRLRELAPNHPQLPMLEASLPENTTP